MKIFSSENIIKALFGAVGLFMQGVIVFYNVKQEIHDNKILDTADKQVINFRLQALEQNFGILPKETKIESAK